MGDVTLKLILLGNIEVGKTSLLLRFTDGSFSEKIVGEVDKRNKDLKIDGKNVRMIIHDTAGQERFRTLTSSYYRNADGIIVVYDITDEDSFNEVEGFLKEGVRYARKAQQFLVGNKIDLNDQRIVSTQQGSTMANTKKIDFFETSAKTGENVEHLFEVVARKLLETASAKPPVYQIDLSPQPSSKKGGICELL